MAITIISGCPPNCKAALCGYQELQPDIRTAKQHQSFPHARAGFCTGEVLEMHSINVNQGSVRAIHSLASSEVEDPVNPE